MNNITGKIDRIVRRTNANKHRFEQIAKFDSTIECLQKIAPVEKPSYNLPLIDTIGKQTYSILNKK